MSDAMQTKSRPSDSRGTALAHEPSQSETSKSAPAGTLVIFGAGGDLTKRLLMPALYNLSGSKLLDDDFAVIGVDSGAASDADFKRQQKASMESFTPEKGGEFSTASLDLTWWAWLESRLFYMQGDFTKDDIFAGLKDKLREKNVVFYLAVADRFFTGIIDRLEASGLTDESGGHFRRLIIEKPFGHDLESAKALNAHILDKLDEGQIYRIDHFLGKETVQNIMALRFGNGLFERIWNRDHIDSIQITAAETVGADGRGKFYEQTGALRDMVPNHMFQLLAMVTMEAPTCFDAASVRGEKARVIAAIREMSAADVERNVARGQYMAGAHDAGQESRSYVDEPDVDSHSDVETYVALKLAIDNDRWAGVPFYLRTGKCLGARNTEIAIQFKPTSAAASVNATPDNPVPNMIVLHIQPHEGISLLFAAKQPGQEVVLKPVQMTFKYSDFFELRPATGYEALIYDVLIGDPVLFNRADNIEAGWRGVQSVLDAIAGKCSTLHAYDAGSDGPDAANALLARDARTWRSLSA